MQRSISGKKQKDCYVREHTGIDVSVSGQKKNRGTRGDSLLILGPKGPLSRKLPLQNIKIFKW